MTKGNRWDQRCERADALLREQPDSQVLMFYRHLLALQATIAKQLAQDSPRVKSSSVPRRDLLDVEAALARFPALLKTVGKEGPVALAQSAKELSAKQGEHRKLLAAFVNRDPETDVLQAFLARILLQPFAEAMALQSAFSPGTAVAVCPACDSKPQLAVLRPEGDGGKRYLGCSLCFTEWEYRRVLCPACGETDPLRLPRFQSEEPKATRVEACDNCKSYLKSFDLTLDGHLVPEVEEIATIALDVWAAENGYRKIEANVLGF
jgi:FdhE protein